MEKAQDIMLIQLTLVVSQLLNGRIRKVSCDAAVMSSEFAQEMYNCVKRAKIPAVVRLLVTSQWVM